MNKLSGIGSNGLQAWNESTETELGKFGAGPFFEELSDWLSLKNGFYAFESALHVFSTAELWAQNDPEGWRQKFGGLTDGHFFFAEDIFGGLFSWKDGQVHSFDPETADSEPIGSSLEAWAQDLLQDYNYRTGYPLAHEWQMRFGAIPAGKRLAPKIPFVGGGKYELQNLYLADPAELMSFRGMLAQKIRSLPDGATLRFKITE